MMQSHFLVDYYEPMMNDWRRELDARDSAILELYHLADGFNRIIAATASPAEHNTVLENTILKKYQGFVLELEKNAAE